MNNNQHARTITGIGIIIVGFAALLGSLDVFRFDDILSSWWPLIVVAAGIIAFINNPRQILWPVLIIGLGILLQLRVLGVFYFNVWQLFWPVVIIAIGWTMLTKRHSAATDTSENTDNLSAILGGLETKNESKDYKGGSISAIMGGGVLDLRHATIKKEATLDIFTLMGGYEIKVPENWIVRSQVSPILGGVENKTISSTKKDAPTLIITGTALLGGVEIHH